MSSSGALRCGPLKENFDFTLRMGSVFSCSVHCLCMEPSPWGRGLCGDGDFYTGAGIGFFTFGLFGLLACELSTHASSTWLLMHVKLELRHAGLSAR